MRRRILTILTALAFVLSLCPVPVWAAEVTEALDFTSQDIVAQGDGYSWDAGSNTLTLNGFTQTIADTTKKVIAINLPANSTLVLEGESTITNSSYGGTCIQYEGALTIQGSGTLNLKLDMVTHNATNTGGTCGKGIYEKDDDATDINNIVTIKDGTLNITGTEENTGSEGYVGISGAEVHLNGGTVNMANVTYGVNAYYWWVDARKFIVDGGTFHYSKNNDYNGDLSYAVSSGSNRNGIGEVSIISGEVDISGAKEAFNVSSSPVSVTGGALKIHNLVRPSNDNTYAFLCGAGSGTEPQICLIDGNIDISGCDYILSAVNTLGMEMLEIGDNMDLTGLVKVDQYGIYPESGHDNLGKAVVRIYGDYTLPESMSFSENYSGFWDIGLAEGSTLTIPQGMTFDLSKLVRTGQQFGINEPIDVFHFSGGKIVNNGVLALPVKDGVDQELIQSLKITGSGKIEVRSHNGTTVTVTATYTNEGTKLLEPAGDENGKLDLSDPNATPPVEGPGYTWIYQKDNDDHITNGTLILSEGFNVRTLILPDATITINVNGDCSIGTLTPPETSPGSHHADKTQLTFDGEGTLTITEHVEISGGNQNSLTVNAGTTVKANNGISISAGAGVDGKITVNGTLIVEQGDGISAINTGKVAVGNTGVLEVSGENGVFLGGMDSSTNFSNLFTVGENGRFTADCKQYTVRVGMNGDNFPGGATAKGAIALAEDFLPANCEAQQTQQNQFDLIDTKTNAPFTGPITIHKYHIWAGSWTYDDTGHWHGCTFAGCDKKEPGSFVAHTLDEYHHDDAKHWQICTVCNYETTHAAHSPSGKFGHDGDGHWDICVCGALVNGKTSHTWATDWTYNSSQHWHACTPCGYRTDTDYHVYDNDQDATCNVCGYVRNVHTHSWSWRTSAAEHWRACSCGQTKDRGSHVYDDDWDTTCDTCGYVREVAHRHVWSEDWETDDTHHWHECTAEDCDISDNSQKEGYDTHDYDDEWDTTCNACGYVREVAHRHVWSEDWETDDTHHWHECTAEDCDITEDSQKEGYAPHEYTDDQDATCDVCGYERTVEKPGRVPVAPTGRSYAVRVETSEHGQVTSSRASAGSGSKVTLTVTPDDGYVLDQLTATDNRENQIDLTDAGGGKYAFTMPGSRVTVTAVFVPANRLCDGGTDCPSRGFADLGGVGTWYHQAVDEALKKGLMSGYRSGLFGPNDPITRAQFAQILHNREGRPVVNYLMQFPDISETAWYAEAVRWAAAQGIVSGYSDGRFDPNDHITREQLVLMLWRYAGSPAASGSGLYFADAGRVGAYAREAMGWAVETGVITGGTGGRLEPKGLATRAQAAQMLKNFADRQQEQ